MTQRVLAAVVAMPLIVALALIAVLAPLPYSSYSPGPTINVLGDPGGREIVQVQGKQTYRDSGQLRMVTVSVSRSGDRLSLVRSLSTWFDHDDAVYPYSVVYPDDQSQQESQQQGQVEMVSSQDTATAVALRALGYTVKPQLEVQGITDGTPADGALALRDQIIAVNGKQVDGSDLNQAATEVRTATASTAAGQSVTFTVLRDGKQQDVKVVPKSVDGTPQVGISLGEGYDFPFSVQVGINPAIGGPSAGTMFALSIYDTLTPGSLTDDGRVAGTGTIADDGTVGAIGGIQQKIVGARHDGAQLFLVPAPNCADTIGAHNGDMRLAKITNFSDALSTVKAWAADHDAKLPTCSGS